MIASREAPLAISALPLLAACGGLVTEPAAAPLAPADPRAAQVGALNLSKLLRSKGTA